VSHDDRATSSTEAMPDERTDAVAYRDRELAVVGDRDPGDVQARTLEDVDAALQRAGERVWTRPSPREWSAGEVVAHLLDIEIFLSARYRWILAHDRPTLVPFDPDLLAERLPHPTGDVGAYLEPLRHLRRANLRLWNATSADERARVGIHAERGPETFELAFRIAAGHDLLHLGQIGRALEPP
jgi:DinB superfamily